VTAHTLEELQPEEPVGSAWTPQNVVTDHTLEELQPEEPVGSVAPAAVGSVAPAAVGSVAPAVQEEQPEKPVGRVAPAVDSVAPAVGGVAPGPASEKQLPPAWVGGATAPYPVPAARPQPCGRDSVPSPITPPTSPTASPVEGPPQLLRDIAAGKQWSPSTDSESEPSPFATAPAALGRAIVDVTNVRSVATKLDPLVTAPPEPETAAVGCVAPELDPLVTAPPEPDDVGRVAPELDPAPPELDAVGRVAPELVTMPLESRASCYTAPGEPTFKTSLLPERFPQSWESVEDGPVPIMATHYPRSDYWMQQQQPQSGYHTRQ